MTLAPRAAGGPATAGAALRAMVYVRDPDSESTLRQCLADLDVEAPSYTTGGIEAAIADLARQASPRLLVVDITGTENPIGRVGELAQLCEPSTGVVVIGDANDVVLYRALKNAGVVEYYFKPLVSSLISQTCNFILTGDGQRPAAHTGKLVTVMGMRGGVGATAITSAAAWQVAEVHHRHALLLDLDLNDGDMALQLDQLPNHTLYEALEQPDRVDDIFLERGVIHVTPRLDLLASLEALDLSASWHEESVLSLLAKLLERYRYVFVDMPPSLAARLPRVLQLPGVCILVSDPSLVAARDVARWRERLGANTPERLVLHVVNKAGEDGALPEEEFVRVLGHTPDLVIPYAREIAVDAMRGAKGLTNNGALSRALAPVLANITGEPVEQNRSLLARLFG